MQAVRRIPLALAAVAVLVLASLASASSVREIGVDNAEKFGKPGCPQNCEAIGQVTGFQARVGKKRDPYVIKRKGKIVGRGEERAAPRTTTSEGERWAGERPRSKSRTRSR